MRTWRPGSDLNRCCRSQSPVPCRLATGLCAGSAYGVRRAVWFTATPAKPATALCPVTVCPVCGIFFLREASLPLSHQPGAARHMGRRGFEPRSCGLRARCNLRYTNGPQMCGKMVRSHPVCPLAYRDDITPTGLEPITPESESDAFPLRQRALAGLPGFEPGSAVLETDMLPLHHKPLLYYFVTMMSLTVTPSRMLRAYRLSIPGRASPLNHL